jgi:preprotein translocase subunit YajC
MLELNLELIDKTAAATILIFAGAILGEYAYRLTKRVLQNIKYIQKLREVGISKPITTVSNLSRLAIYVFILFLLIKLEIVELFIDFLMVLVLIAIAFSLLFVTKDITASLYYSSKIKQKLKPGQYIKVSGLEGTINKVHLDEIRITTKDNNVAIISKEFLAKNKFKILHK